MTTLLAAARWHEAPAREIGWGLKDGDPVALRCAARQMAELVGFGVVLVPIPNRCGRAVATLALAERIGELAGAPVADVLRGVERGSWAEAKRHGGAVDLTLTATERPPGRIVLVDNVLATGATARAALAALPGADVLTHSTCKEIHR